MKGTGALITAVSIHRNIKMEMKDIIEKVNHYSQLARTRELTEEEKEERAKYRNLYMTNFRANFKNHLDSIKVKYVDENGNEIKGN